MNLSFHNCVCSRILVLKNDYSVCLMTLMKYPASTDVKMMLRKALTLRSSKVCVYTSCVLVCLEVTALRFLHAVHNLNAAD